MQELLMMLRILPSSVHQLGAHRLVRHLPQCSCLSCQFLLVTFFRPVVEFWVPSKGGFGLMALPGTPPPSAHCRSRQRGRRLQVGPSPWWVPPYQHDHQGHPRMRGTDTALRPGHRHNKVAGADFDEPIRRNISQSLKGYR